jgi:hypothetical protein
MVGCGQAKQAIAMGQGLFRARDAWLPPVRRVEILRKAAQLMQERAEPLVLDAGRKGGKPLVDSRVEVARAIEWHAELRRDAVIYPPTKGVYAFHLSLPSFYEQGRCGGLLRCGAGCARDVWPPAQDRSPAQITVWDCRMRNSSVLEQHSAN